MSRPFDPKARVSELLFARAIWAHYGGDTGGWW